MAESETEEKQKTDSESIDRAHLEVTAPRSSPRPSPRSSPRASPTLHRRKFKFDEPAKTDGKRWGTIISLASAVVSDPEREETVVLEGETSLSFEWKPI